MLRYHRALEILRKALLLDGSLDYKDLLPKSDLQIQFKK